MALYDTIGRNYVQTRRSDPRIVTELLRILQASSVSTVVDIGAGTGSYALPLANQGYQVLAVEPSAVMREQAISHPSIQWFDGCAEHLPLPDQTADAAIVMLAFHHFQDDRQALQEIYRVIGRGQIVLFTYDPAMIRQFWLTEYFPAFIIDVETTFLPISTLISNIKTITGKAINRVSFPLPRDLADSFMAVGWARPELYLERRVRHGISSFSKLNATERDSGLSRLQRDLKTEVWDQQYGHLRTQQNFDIGYCFLHTH
ncbi:MAG: methyltransferase domain-containing protein [Tildeniella nuda ZEHNDER 1965/U140]|jgi:SAM-dependent methyltransferase|nr:methyltransferase domain-containing protein [Tildeniella nuda ZEHNDER 1965/U140]